MLRASDIFPGENGDAKVKEIKAWLNTQGVRDFEPVSLFCEQLKKVSNWIFTYCIILDTRYSQQ